MRTQVLRMNYCPECRTELVTQGIHGNRVQRCSKCGFINWDNPAPVATGVVVRGGKIVLVKSRTRDNRWGLPSGFVEKSERAEDALIREVKEETGLNASVRGSLGTYPVENARKRVLLIAYEAVAEEGMTKPDNEISEIDEVSSDEALKMLTGIEERQILVKWLERRAKAN